MNPAYGISCSLSANAFAYWEERTACSTHCLDQGIFGCMLSPIHSKPQSSPSPGTAISGKRLIVAPKSDTSSSAGRKVDSDDCSIESAVEMSSASVASWR